MNSDTKTRQIVTEKQLAHLPAIVQQWLRLSGTVGKPAVQQVNLEQDLKMKLRPGQTKWYTAKAHQHFCVEPPAFEWKVKLKMNALLQVRGTDRFADGKGSMTIKLLGFLPLVNAGNNAKIDQATLQRYLAEIVWFPSAALHPDIVWEPHGKNAAKATMRCKSTAGSGIFYFTDSGDFSRFEALRYKDATPDAKPLKWVVTALQSAVHYGILIPVDLKADWELESGLWTWLRLKITNINYT